MGADVTDEAMYRELSGGSLQVSDVATYALKTTQVFSSHHWLSLDIWYTNVTDKPPAGHIIIPVSPVFVQLTEVDKSRGYKRGDFYHFPTGSIRCSYHRTSEPGMEQLLGSDWRRDGDWDTDISRLVEHGEVIKGMIGSQELPDRLLTHPIVTALLNNTLKK